MVKFDNDEELKKFISDEVLFSSEAANFLDISNQRLNQLVQSGKLEPIKSSKSGSLYLRKDLQDRLAELSIFDKPKNPPIALEPISSNKAFLFGNDPRIINEAMNYFTLQALHNNSMKKTKPIYEELKETFNLFEPCTNYLKELSTILKVNESDLLKSYDAVVRGFNQLNETDHVVKIGQDFYPKLLERTEQAPPFLFMRGNLNLVNYQAVAVVGTREPSEDGRKKAMKLASVLGHNRIVVASGLAKGIDRAAHEGALANNNPTIAVIGTPLTKYYPRENSSLQKQISEEGLIISQFPPSSSVQRWNFPLRNSVMSGISLATVIIEAGETSGALIQADYALKQNRLVFIPQSALSNEKLKWPHKYIKKEGAESFAKIEDLIRKLENSNVLNFLNKNENFHEKNLLDVKQLSLFEE
ncbi:DNA-processing protein DprA [Paenibacillus illinoisensis]|uniref:DNA-processing protein DprA n=1 Tax=Paenibacillus illinoisensis TaxID=59845 RepID=UPI00301E34C1